MKPLIYPLYMALFVCRAVSDLLKEPLAASALE